MARFFVAGLFTYLFARRLGTNGIAAFAAAVAFSFSGFFMVYVNGQPPDFAMLVPVVLYSFELLFQRRSAGTIAFATLAVALSVLSGNPEGTFALLLFGGGYYLARAATEAYRQGSLRPLRSIVPLGACLLLGIGLSAFALAPFVELSGFGGVGGHSVHLHPPERRLGLTFDSLRYLISLFVPYFDGPPTSSFQGGGWTGIRNYVGVVVPLLAIMGLGNRRLMSGGGWFFAAAAILLLGKTYGVGAVNWVGHLPVFNQMFFAVYFAPLIAFSLAMLAAFGVDQLTRRDIRTRHVLAGARLPRGAPRLAGLAQPRHPGHHPGRPSVRISGWPSPWWSRPRQSFSLVRRKARRPAAGVAPLDRAHPGELFFFVMPVKGRLPGLGRPCTATTSRPIRRPERYDPFTSLLTCRSSRETAPPTGYSAPTTSSTPTQAAPTT